jgi:hypothetical protein
MIVLISGVRCGKNLVLFGRSGWGRTLDWIGLVLRGAFGEPRLERTF